MSPDVIYFVIAEWAVKVRDGMPAVRYFSLENKKTGPVNFPAI